jgi:ABC-type transporter MlaC component
MILLCSCAVNASPRESITATYRALLNEFSAELAERQELYKQDPDAYWLMVQRVVVPLWSRLASLEGLATLEKVSALNHHQRHRLNTVLDQTVQRYAFEILDNFSGQQFVLNHVSFEASRPNLAVLDITAVWNNFPDLDIELMLVDEGDAWRFYNIRYGWFSYIGAKQWSYRRGLSPSRFDDFIATLAKKNQRYFTDLCRNETLTSSQVCLEWHDRLSFE